MNRLIALPLAFALVSPAFAERSADLSLLQQYVRARVADAEGDLDKAAAGYAAALAARPDDPVLATRAFREAISAGDRSLAMQAAVQLDARGLLPPDGTLLLFTNAVSARKWSAARGLTDRIQKENAFGFLVPALRAWVALGEKDRDPAHELDAPGAGSLAAAYAPEQRALLALARKKYDDGLAALKALGTGAEGIPPRLRLAAAATLAAHGHRKDALALLAGADPTLAAARTLVEARKPLPGAIDTPAAGVAELFARVAIDINRERVTPLALTLARLATFLAPDNSDGWLVTSQLLAAGESFDAALAAIDRVKPNDPLFEAARQARILLLVRKGEQQTALIEAEGIARSGRANVADWRRLGDLYTELQRHQDAVEAFRQAIALADADPAWAELRWVLQLQYGSALEKLGRWPEAKVALEKSVALAPDEPVALNYLGYVQLERRENLKEAETLIAKASQLKPDDAAITDSLGWAYYLQGDIARAIATLERAAAGQPGDPTVNEHLGDAYWQVGRRFEARYAWRAALVHAEAKDAERIRGKIDGGLSHATGAP